MTRYGPVMMVGVAVMQVFLLASVPQKVTRTVAAAPPPEGWSLLVDRISDSPYGLMDPIDTQEPEGQQPNNAPPVFFYTDFQPETKTGEVQLQNVPPEQVRQLIKIEANNQGIDPQLIESIVRNESGFNPHAVSPVGAVGLMQLMPETAASLGVNPYDPGQNLQGGVRYFSQQLRRYGGDVSLALAAYNAGPGAVERFGGIPPYAETMNYVDRVIGDYQGARGYQQR